MGLSAARARSGWPWLASAACWLCLAACVADPETTGVRLAIRYDAVPTRLRVEGQAIGGAHYGPELLPNPPRALYADGETVVLALSDELAGHMLVLDVIGLDSQGRTISQARQQVHVVKSSIVQLVVQLRPTMGTVTPPLADAGSTLPSDGGVLGPTPSAPEPASDSGAVAEPVIDSGSGAASPTPDSAGGQAPAMDAGSMEPAPKPDAGKPDAGCGTKCQTAGSGGAPAAGSGGSPAAGSGGAPMAGSGGAPAAGSGGAPMAGSGPPPMERCGDGVCQAARMETRCSCPQDCGASTCGDGVCCPENNENICSCAADCGASSCGDGLCCAAANENSCTCAKDCGQPTDVNCAYTCSDSTCMIDCTRAKSCSAVCTGTAQCTINCKDAMDCSAVRCESPAGCLLQCDGSKNCGFALCPAGAMSCSKNLVACNRSCPP